MSKNDQAILQKCGTLEIRFESYRKVTRRQSNFYLSIEKQGVKRISFRDNEIRKIVLPIGLKFNLTESIDNCKDSTYKIENKQEEIGTGTTVISIKEFYNNSQKTKYIRGQILWEYDYDENLKIPNSVKVGIKKEDGTILEYRDVYKDEKDRWAYYFNLPQCDDSGEEVKYEVFQEKLEKFETIVSGNNIKNIFYEAVSYTVEIANSDPKKEHIFELRLEDLSTNSSRESNIILVTEPKIYQFLPLNFIKPGTYNYQIQILPLFNNNRIYVPIELDIEVRSVDLKLEISNVNYTHQGRYYSCDVAKIDQAIL